MLKLTVQLVAWNGAKYIPLLFASLRRQTFSGWNLLVLDNASTDGTSMAIQKELQSFSFSHEFIQSKENRGFADGHNSLFQKGDSEYILLLNQDMVLEPNCLEKLMRCMQDHPNAAAVTPRLMKWDFARNEHTNIVDAIGLKVFRNRRVVEWLTGHCWADSKDEVIHSLVGQTRVEVFGVSGALPMYRRTSLREVAHTDGSIFDPTYGSYKEDVDLAFRLRAVGAAAFVVLDAVAYHDRTAAGTKHMGDVNAAANKRQQSRSVQYQSYKNHVMTLIKNEYWQNTLLDFPWILWYELKKFLWLLLFQQSVLAGVKEVWHLRITLREKRRYLAAKRLVSWKEMRRWWVDKR